MILFGEKRGEPFERSPSSQDLPEERGRVLPVFSTREKRKDSRTLERGKSPFPICAVAEGKGRRLTVVPF